MAGAPSILADVPDAIAAPSETVIVTLHAEGAQIYECKAGENGQLGWAAREPIASLMLDGKTVGRHYAGRRTGIRIDGSAVTAKVRKSRAPGKTASDIPWLKLDVTERRGSGLLSSATTILRINTRGGIAPTGACDKAGTLASVAYATDYVFLKKP